MLLSSHEHLPKLTSQHIARYAAANLIQNLHHDSSKIIQA